MTTIILLGILLTSSSTVLGRDMFPQRFQRGFTGGSQPAPTPGLFPQVATEAPAPLRTNSLLHRSARVNYHPVPALPQFAFRPHLTGRMPTSAAENQRFPPQPNPPRLGIPRVFGGNTNYQRPPANAQFYLQSYQPQHRRAPSARLYDTLRAIGSNLNRYAALERRLWGSGARPLQSKMPDEAEEDDEESTTKKPLVKRIDFENENDRLNRSAVLSDEQVQNWMQSYPGAGHVMMNKVEKGGNLALSVLPYHNSGYYPFGNLVLNSATLGLNGAVVYVGTNPRLTSNATRHWIRSLPLEIDVKHLLFPAGKSEQDTSKLS